MHILKVIADAMFDDRFLWPYGFPVRVEQHGSTSASVELNLAGARPDIIDTFMAQWKTPVVLEPEPRNPGGDRTLFARVRIVDVVVDLYVFVSADALAHIDIKEN